MRIGIYANELRDINFKCTRELIEILKKNKIEYAVSENATGVIGNCELLNPIELSRNCDALIVLGGDGTMLNVVKGAAMYNVPVVGVNLGTLGFLAEVERSQLDELVGILKNKKYYIETRSMLAIHYDKNTYYALNDLVVSKGQNTRPIRLQAEIDGSLLDEYFADGIIISTPTGSTAYSVSNGGPILSPDIQGLIVNPICAHSLHSRPIVVSDKHSLTILPIKLDYPAQIVVDGEYVEDFYPDSRIDIIKSPYKATFIRINQDGFYRKLLSKLNMWSVTDLKKE